MPARVPAPRGGLRRLTDAPDPRRREGRAARAHSALDSDRRPGLTPLRHRRASWRGRQNQAPAANSGWSRRAARSGCRGPARQGRRRSSTASICRNRCGQSGRRAPRLTPIIRRPTIAACRQKSAQCLSTGSAAAPSLNSGSPRVDPPAGSGCGEWSGRARTETSNGRARQRISGRRSLRRRNAGRS